MLILFSDGIWPPFRDIVNLLAAVKASVSVAKFLAGDSLTVLCKLKQGSLPDVRPIAVGETLGRLMQWEMPWHLFFFQPLQYGVACAYGSENVVHGLRNCIELGAFGR